MSSKEETQKLMIEIQEDMNNQLKELTKPTDE
jgi:hypothetical protein